MSTIRWALFSKMGTIRWALFQRWAYFRWASFFQRSATFRLISSSMKVGKLPSQKWSSQTTFFSKANMATLFASVIFLKKKRCLPQAYFEATFGATIWFTPKDLLRRMTLTKTSRNTMRCRSTETIFILLKQNPPSSIGAPQSSKMLLKYIHYFSPSSFLLYTRIRHSFSDVFHWNYVNLKMDKTQMKCTKYSVRRSKL